MRAIVNGNLFVMVLSFASPAFFRGRLAPIDLDATGTRVMVEAGCL
jgi:hypothetical protein